MKNKTIISILVLLAIAFLWSCEKEQVISSDQEISTRAKGGIPGPPGGGGGGGDDDSDGNPLWQVEYDGSIIYSTLAYGIIDVNNPKYELMQTDACGKFTFSGITALDDIANNCAANFPSNYCVDGTGIRQWDLKKDPGHVANHLWILHPEGNLNLKMYGWLQNGATTIFPASGSVSVEFEAWELNSPNCDEVTGGFSSGEASVTITRLTVSDCSSTIDQGNDTCDP